jgi:DNA repair protein RadC
MPNLPKNIASDIFNEFNNAFSVILSNLQLAESQSHDYIKRYIRRALRAAVRIESLMPQLIECSDGHGAPSNTGRHGLGIDVDEGSEKLDADRDQYRYDATDNIRILLVDDEPHLIFPLRERLQYLGYQVITAENGREAIRLLQDKGTRVNLAVLDIVMPEKSGIEVFEYIREHCNEVKVLIYSGKNLKEYADVLKGVDILYKPFGLEDFVRKVQEAVEPDKEYSPNDTINRIRYYFLKHKTIDYQDKLSDPQVIYRLFRYLAFEPRENVLAIYLDSQNKLLAQDLISIGTLNNASVYPKEIVKTALLTNASSVVLLHNHLSDSLTPSDDDIVMTASVRKVCDTVDVRLLDHLIISEEGFFSFAREGLL